MDFLGSIFGTPPKIADYTPVDLQAEQLKALEGDIAAWPDIAQLGNLFQQYMLNQYETAIPGFRDILKMGGQTTQEMLSQASQELQGKIPADVQAAVERSSAYQSLMGGYSGSPMAAAGTARNLGLTSLDLIGQGAQLAGMAGNAAQRWAALSGAQLPEGMLVTPQQQAALDMQQNLIERNIQQQKFNVAAAPNPAAQAVNQWIEQVGGTILSAYATGGMSKGGSFATQYNPAQYGAGDTTTNWGSNVGQGTGATGGFGNAYTPIQSTFNELLPTGGYGAATPTTTFNIDPSMFGSMGGPTGATGTGMFGDYLNTAGFYSGSFGG